MSIAELRRHYHERVCVDIIRVFQHPDGRLVPNFSDIGSSLSIQIALGIIERLGNPVVYGKQKEQTTGGCFERITKEFLQDSFLLLQHLRPGEWQFLTSDTHISNFEQYEHLARVDLLVQGNQELASTLGIDYLVKPDIVITRSPVSDNEINSSNLVVENNSTSIASLSPFRAVNHRSQPNYPILHASISCKWTIRSDRSQNSRTEALNLIRNRKGNLPHIVAVTAEPLPRRIAALALGTGDLDCVYHFALNELRETIGSLTNPVNRDEQTYIIDTMINGKRLRDISDLPFDLIA